MSARHGKLFSDLSANCFHSQRKYLSGSEGLKNTCGSGFISQVFLLGLICSYGKIFAKFTKIGETFSEVRKNYDVSGKLFVTLRAKSSRISSRHGTEKRERLCRTCVHSLWSRQSKNLDNYV